MEGIMKKFNLNPNFMVFKGNLSKWFEETEEKKVIQLVKKAGQKIPGILFLEDVNFEIIIPSPEIAPVEIREIIHKNFKGLNIAWVE
jgi:hypothetical protein